MGPLMRRLSASTDPPHCCSEGLQASSLVTLAPRLPLTLSTLTLSLIMVTLNELDDHDCCSSEVYTLLFQRET
jgi:hypothetical protein